MGSLSIHRLNMASLSIHRLNRRNMGNLSTLSLSISNPLVLMLKGVISLSL